MGSMRFQVLHPDRIVDGALDRVTMCGMDELPWRSRTKWDGPFVVVEREETESGNVFFPWQVEGHGELVLSTTSLMERDQPYQLEVELARGLVHQLRSHLAAWEAVGLVVPQSVIDGLAEAMTSFSCAATLQHKPAMAAKRALDTIASAIDAAFVLGENYSEQALAVRRRQTPTLPTLLGVNLGSRVPSVRTASKLVATFNTMVVPIRWREIEAAEGHRKWRTTDKQIAWCQKYGLTVFGGPLLRFDAEGVPDWTYLWESDFESVARFMIDHVQEVVSRYRGDVHLWQVASRINTGDALSLTEEQRMRIVGRAIEVTRKIDPDTPVIVTFDQPWAEYMAQRELDLPPIYFADALVRANLGLAGLGLEINAGYHPQGTMPYHPIAYSRQLDRWSLFGLPLIITLTSPSSMEDDPHATSKVHSLPVGAGGNISPETQRDWITRYLPMILSKNCVQAIVWNQFDDRLPHDYPHGGLLDHNGKAKPAFDALRSIREEYLA